MWGKTAYTKEELQQYFNDPQARREQSEVNQRDRRSQMALLGVAGVAAFFALLFLLFTIYMIFLVTTLPSLDDLQNPKLNLASIAYTADGKELTRYMEDNRKWIELKDISPYVKNALVATEDRRFYDHWGVDMYALVGLPIKWLQGKSQGGSTITQQLARNLYESIGQERTVNRKLKEMMTAIELERSYTKDEIIELYLNTVEYLYRAHGIEAASRTYFNKSPKMLSLAESALMIGMVQNPILYNPGNPDRIEMCKTRRNTVLMLMTEQGFITAEQAEQASKQPIAVEINHENIHESLAPYFADYVRQWMNEYCKEKGCDINRDGFKIYTTLDSRMQKSADEAAKKQGDYLQQIATSVHPRSSFGTSRLVDTFVKETPLYQRLLAKGGQKEALMKKLKGDKKFMDSLYAVKARLELSLVGMDPNNGFVRAWVGGRDFSVDEFDHVSLAKRQPGSTFKPFVYTAAFESGYGEEYKILDAALPLNCEGSGRWMPKNSGSSGSGAYVTLKHGLIKSLNTVTAQLACKVGSRKFIKYAQDLGVSESLKNVHPSPAMALGTAEVTLLEMATAYSTFADHGVLHKAIPVTRIEDRYGNIVETFYPSEREVLNPNTAYTIVNILRGVIAQGTASSLRGSFGIPGAYDIAGKTGTTQDATDGWFMLMHHDMVTGSWVGFNDRRMRLTESAGQGARTGMRVVGDFFHRLINDKLVSTQKMEKPANYKPPRNTVKQVYDKWAPRRTYRPKPRTAPARPKSENGGGNGGGNASPAPAPAAIPAPKPPERRFDW
jgi:penicillin-binding protein 1A